MQSLFLTKILFHKRADLNFIEVDRVSTRGGGTAQRVAKNPAPALGGQAQTVKDKGAQEGRVLSDDEVKTRQSGLAKILKL